MDSLTGVGESYGVPFSRSKLLAVEEINAAGGINGRTLKLIVEDTKCTANDAITAYRRLTDVEGIKIILGPTCSSGTLGVAPLAEKEGVIIFSPSSTSPDGFRDCLYELTRSGAIGDDYSFDENGDVVGLTHVLIEVLPVAERTDENLGFRVLGPPPTP